MYTINIQRKHSTATIECAEGYIRFYDGQIADAYDALRTEFFNEVQHWNDNSLEDQHIAIMRCIRDIGYNAGVLVKGQGRVIFSGIILNDTIPDGYITLNDGMFGEWNLWLDDALGTIIGNGYESKQDAVSAAWQHKTSQAKGDVMNNVSIYDAKTEAEFVQGAKNLAYDIASQQSYTEIVNALIEDEVESVSEVFQQGWDNYTCYSPFEVVMSAINKLGEDESQECWDSIQEAVQEVFESVAGEVLKGVKSELQERIEAAEDSYELSDEDYDEFIDEVSDEVRIGNLTFAPSDVIKSCDPIAYNIGKQEYQDMMLEDDEEIQALVSLLDNVTI